MHPDGAIDLGRLCQTIRACGSPAEIQLRFDVSAQDTFRDAQACYVADVGAKTVGDLLGRDPPISSIFLSSNVLG